MKNNKVLLALIFIIGNTFSVFAQEQLAPLIFGQSEQAKKTIKSNRSIDTIIYLVDTLDLPFIDDFSKNKVRSLSVPNPDLIVDSVSVKFRVNGVAADSFKIKLDTTYSFVYDSSSGLFNPNPNKRDTVTFYNIGQPNTNLYGWPAKRFYQDQSGISVVHLVPDSQGVNTVDSIQLVLDSPNYFWTTNGALYNNSLAINQPSFGIMSFDGTDKAGVPYDLVSSNSYGIADILTSKPIQLEYPSTDSIFLSFFYLPEGLAEPPEEEDSLVLQFYSPETNKWNWVWSTKGITSPDFKEVFIQVTDSMYLQKGFQFRFFNYATLSGSFDMWHLDYIRLGRFRRNNDAIDDLTIVSPPHSYIKDYTSMPWSHFKKDPISYTILDFEVNMKNLSEYGKPFTNYYKVFDSTSEVFSSTSVSQTCDADIAAQPGLPFKVCHFLNSSIQNNFSFPTTGKLNEERVTFWVLNSTKASPDVNIENDTISTKQIFDTYYSYDDGTAEQAYSVNEAGAMVAYKFNSVKTDTLEAVLMSFPDMLEDMSDRRFKIIVWTDLNSDPIYEGVLREPKVNGVHDFNRYPLADPVVVSGEFYVGWLQTLQKKMYVGFDLNIDNSQNIFYTVNNGSDWFNTSFKGSLLVRPDFGQANVPSAGIKGLEIVETEIDNIFNFYPNPVQYFLTIAAIDIGIHEYQIFNLQGKLILSNSFSTSTQLNIGDLAPGAYLLKVTNSSSDYTQNETLIVR